MVAPRFYARIIPTAATVRCMQSSVACSLFVEGVVKCGGGGSKYDISKQMYSSKYTHDYLIIFEDFEKMFDLSSAHACLVERIKAFCSTLY